MDAEKIAYHTGYDAKRVGRIIANVKKQTPAYLKILGSDNPLIAPLPKSIVTTFAPPAPLPPATAPIPKAIGLPPRHSAQWFDELLKNKTGQQLGTNVGGVYELNGERYYVKLYTDAAQGRGEHLSNTIYRELGLNSPESIVGQASDGTHIYASKWIDGLKGTGKSLGVTKETANKFMDGFVADVFTANWDAAGTGLDNLGILKNGQVVRLDQGGSLLFRAKAGMKPDAVLNQIDEWTKFFDGSNPHYKDVAARAGFSSADDIGLPRLKKQIEGVLGLVSDHTSLREWDEFVLSRVSGISNNERSQLGVMLQSRAVKLSDKYNELLAAETAAKQSAAAHAERMAAWAKGGKGPTPWPIADNVVRAEGKNYEKLVRAQHDSWVATLMKEERVALGNYTGSEYQNINNVLREGVNSASEVSRKNKLKADTIHRALDKAPTPPPPELVWRAERSSLQQNLMEKMASGDVIQLNGLQSTSVNPSIAHNWSSSTKYLYEIMPKRGAYVEAISSSSGEKEFLLPHGASYLVRGARKVKIQQQYGGIVERTVIMLEMLP
jgi:hypothetical protein